MISTSTEEAAVSDAIISGNNNEGDGGDNDGGDGALDDIYHQKRILDSAAMRSLQLKLSYP
jgi:hypothetical protein